MELLQSVTAQQTNATEISSGNRERPFADFSGTGTLHTANRATRQHSANENRINANYSWKPIRKLGKLMNNDDLKQLLESLRQNLEDSSTIDEQVAEKMRLLADEIQNALMRSASKSHAGTTNPSLAESIRELMDDFQVQHPQLTSNLASIAERLADMGI